MPTVTQVPYDIRVEPATVPIVIDTRFTVTNTADVAALKVYVTTFTVNTDVAIL